MELVSIGFGEAAFHICNDLTVNRTLRLSLLSRISLVSPNRDWCGLFYGTGTVLRRPDSCLAVSADEPH